jgi:hypothetical protein
MQILDKANGRIWFSDYFSASAITKVDELIAALGVEKFEVIDIHPGRAHCKIRNVKLGEQYFLFDFYFKNDFLHSVIFIVSDTPISAGNWSDWSEKKEQENKRFYDKWLTGQLSNYRKFKWGAVEALYDVRAGGSSISLNYNS